jgi:FMN phosphatase YigB (HAD superfamily)
MGVREVSRMNNAPLLGAKACVFDAYGTLFDFASAAKGCRDVPGEAIDKLTALWRERRRLERRGPALRHRRLRLFQ